MKVSKINIMEIVPAYDVLMDDLENIKGGNGLNICLKGCVGGDDKKKEEEAK